jgi:hypothetical protein
MAITLDGTTGITTPGLTNTGTETIVNLTTTGNTILGNASTDTLNVGNGDLIKDASGNLLVGLPTSVDGKVQIKVTTANWGLAINHTNATTQYLTSFMYNGTAIGSITGNNTNTTYTTSSDYRLKENIVPMVGALAKVSLLKPVTYSWRIDGSNSEGFIAHELAEVVPDCVTGEKDAIDVDGKPVYQGIDTSFLVATLTAAIQEQQALITSLTARLELLEAK